MFHKRQAVFVMQYWQLKAAETNRNFSADKILACAQTKLHSGELRLRNSAEILVLDFQLCTQIWVRATIGQFKKAFVLFVVIANQVEGKFETHFR